MRPGTWLLIPPTMPLCAPTPGTPLPYAQPILCPIPLLLETHLVGIIVSSSKNAFLRLLSHSRLRQSHPLGSPTWGRPLARLAVQGCLVAVEWRSPRTGSGTQFPAALSPGETAPSSELACLKKEGGPRLAARRRTEPGPKRRDFVVPPPAAN